jgi:hypothetical protein
MDTMPIGHVERPQSALLEVFCSQCGESMGMGEHGYSHCQDHAHIVRMTDEEEERLWYARHRTI